jgi:hypothetical protein
VSAAAVIRAARAQPTGLTYCGSIFHMCCTSDELSWEHAVLICPSRPITASVHSAH